MSGISFSSGKNNNAHFTRSTFRCFSSIDKKTLGKTCSSFCRYFYRVKTPFLLLLSSKGAAERNNGLLQVSRSACSASSSLFLFSQFFPSVQKTRLCTVGFIIKWSHLRLRYWALMKFDQHMALMSGTLKTAFKNRHETLTEENIPIFKVNCEKILQCKNERCPYTYNLEQGVTEKLTLKF